MLEERKLSWDRWPSFSLFIFCPLVGIEENIPVWKVEKFTQESKNLSFSSKGVVANSERRLCVLSLHGYDLEVFRVMLNILISEHYVEIKLRLSQF